MGKRVGKPALTTGNDGGSIPRRSEMVQTQKRPTRDREAEQLAEHEAWLYCALSGAPLRRPVMSCGLGRLYNKEAVLEHILQGPERFPDTAGAASHVASLRDVQEVVLQEAAGSQGRFVCPVTMREMDEHSRFVYFVPCGHAVDRSGLENVHEDGCIVCGEAYNDRDIIAINAKGDELRRLRGRLDTLRGLGLSHALKPVKKGKKKHAAATHAPDARPAKTSSVAQSVLEDLSSRKRPMSETVKSIYRGSEVASKRQNVGS